MSPSRSQRFLTHVAPEPVGDCLIWIGGATPTGYGCFWDGKRPIYAHRFAYEFCVGPIPPGLEIDHLCRRPSCVNVLHMEPVTHYENLRRGESIFAQQLRRTHCPQGHPYEGANLMVQDGKRKCRVCVLARKRDHGKRYYQAHKEQWLSKAVRRRLRRLSEIHTLAGSFL